MKPVPYGQLWKLRTSALRRYRRLQRSLGVTTVTCRYFGARFRVDIRDLMGFEIATGRLEFGDIRKFLAACSRLRPSIFIDVGANVGLYSCIAGRHRVAPRIVAFEPDPRNFAGLARNITLNACDDLIEARPHAVGDVEGEAFLHIAPLANSGLSTIRQDGTHRVRVTPLACAFMLRDETIAVKIDVEGHEPSVLRGAQGLFSDNYGFAMIEAHDAAMHSTTDFMQSRGWRLIERHGLNLMFERLKSDAGPQEAARNAG
jgi:FkbM family methyltransferase